MTAWKALFFGVAAISSLGTTRSDIPATEYPEIVRVECLGGSGSAFRVGPNLLLTVAHVTSVGGCFIGGKPFRVAETRGDFAVLTMPEPSRQWLRIDCRGFVAGRRYAAVGFARGLPTQTSVDLVATGDTLAGLAVLKGVFTAVPGQSGGAVIDVATRRPVGTVNAYQMRAGLTGSVELKGTSVCRA